MGRKRASYFHCRQIGSHPFYGGAFPTLIAIITMFFTGSLFTSDPASGSQTAGSSPPTSASSAAADGSWTSIANGLWASIGPTLLLTGVILFGIFLTIIMSKLLSKTVLKGMPSAFALELPPYRRPQIGKVIVRSILDRTLFVLGRAVAVAAPAGLLIWILANINAGGSSLLAHITGFLDPFAAQFGIDGVILAAFILGFPANEIVVPIMLMCYLSTGSLQEMDSLSQLRDLLIANGWTSVTALCTMLLCLVHFPCGTTCWTIKKETRSWKWTGLAFLLPTATGLLICFVVSHVAELFL